MKKIAPVVFSLIGAVEVFATAPVIRANSVTLTQQSSRMVRVEYTLDEQAAIVTLDIQTNGVSIGSENITYLSGDVNKVVQPGANRVIQWRADKSWPGHLIPSGVTAVVTAWALETPPDYMVTSLVESQYVRYYTSAGAVPGGITNDLYKTDMMAFRKIPAANVVWRMGSPVKEWKRAASNIEKPHHVTLTNDYWMGVYPVTQRQYEILVTSGTRPAYFKNNDCYRMRPVEYVSYDVIRGTTCSWPANGHQVAGTSFLGLLRAHSGIATCDLPTEAQWEFACRAGCGDALYNGSELDGHPTSTQVNKLARYDYNGGKVGGTTDPARTCTAENGTAVVGSYEPNDYGLYDMYGNVWEWCLDYWSDDPSTVDPEVGGLRSDTYRVRRGGSWQNGAENCRSAARSTHQSEKTYSVNGFRVCAIIGAAP